MGEQKKQRLLYIDILNILACLAVISLHHNGLVHSFEDTLAWRESLVVECGLYWAVPVFLMITGVNLLNYREKYDTSTYFRKRVMRTVIPWLAWSFLVLGWKVVTGQLILEEKTAGYVLNLVLNYKVENVYWFFGALFACYLAIPVFSLLTKNRKILWYAAALNFIFLSCLPVLKVWLGFSWSLDIPVTGSLILYVLLGYLFGTGELKRSQRTGIYLLGIFGFLLRFVYTYIMSVKTGKTDTSIKGYIMFHAVFLSVAIFIWIRQINWKKYLPCWLIDKLPLISSCSFGIYLMHRVVMYYERSWLGLSTKSHWWRIACIPLTYLISLGIVLILKKIPVVRKLLV